MGREIATQESKCSRLAGLSLRCFPTHPSIAGTDISSDGELCILLPSYTAHSANVPSCCGRTLFSPKRTLEMHAYDKQYLLMPMGLAEKGDDFELARFRILERSE
jgi:hypothetical protein